jgi:rhodanese-related sulfurtransferase
MKREKSIAGLILLTFLISPCFAAKKESPATIEGSTKVNAEQLIEAANSSAGLTIIDSRLIDDRHQGYIPDSISLPDEATSCASLSKLLPSLSTPALYYCNGPMCNRSGNAVKIAIECGYSNIYWFRGGIKEWREKKYPMIQD